MATRRDFLRGGLGALALGLASRRSFGAAGLWGAPSWSSRGPSNPFLELPRSPASIRVDGLPFRAWFTGDDFRDNSIPFHTGDSNELPEPSEEVDVVVVGGGIAGLSAAYFLRRYRPVVIELRDRFGGSALGESWAGIPFSLGGAYVITPDEGSFLEEFYADLGLDQVYRESFPPDPMELGGEILDDFWSGAGLPPGEQEAFRRYAEVVRYMADEGYPEIPLADDPDSVEWVLDLDHRTFREDVEKQIGRPLPPLLAAGVQSYFYSSFCAGIDEVSAAAGWNFVAAEEYGRWVFPGGNTYMAWALWNRLRALDDRPALHARASRLRPRCRAIDVRLSGRGVRVTYVDPEGTVRALWARHAVLAGSKHVCKYILHGLETLDPQRLASMHAVDTGCYLVANVLLNAPIERDFYDVFLIGDRSFPMDPGQVERQLKVVDMLRGDYNDPSETRSVLTLYWPLPYATARGKLLTEGWSGHVDVFIPQLRRILELIELPESAIEQVRITRWGHAVPIARPRFIVDGHAERLRRPLGGRIHFANQDNWALPAVENSVLDARAVASAIEESLKEEGRPTLRQERGQVYFR